MNIEKLYNPQYDLLSVDEKKALLEHIGSERNLRPISFKTFEAFGKSTFTAVYLSEDRHEFVFVPGAKVKLGLDLGNSYITEIFDAQTLEDIAYAYSEYDDEDELDDNDDPDEHEALRIRKKLEDKDFLTEMKSYFSDHLSKEEECLIHPLFAERVYNESCWEQLSENDLKDNQEYQKVIADTEKKGYRSITISRSLRLYKDNGIWQADVYRDTTFRSLLRRLNDNGYSLPTKREWEYLAGKGCGSIFPWGNSMDFSMKLKHMNLGNDGKYTLEQENFFGLVIGDDPYQREIVYSDGIFSYKGGDGGCNICGGLGPTLGYFPTSPYYENDEETLDESVNGEYDFYRRIIRIVE